MKNYSLVTWRLRVGMLAFVLAVGTVSAQEPKPSPTQQDKTKSTKQQSSEPEDFLGDYSVVSSIEVGLRGLSVSGSDEKYRSDLNYKPGVRLFDSSFLLRHKDQKGGAFDELLVNSSGWRDDPTGYTRINVVKTGLYSFDGNIRRAKYFNALTSLANPLNQAVGQHTQNARHHFGDYDLTLLPDNDRLKFHLGFSRDTRRGPAITTLRFSGDEYAVGSNQEMRANNFRAGVDAKLLGFDVSFLQGARYFKDDTSYAVNVTNPGNNGTNNSRIDSLLREIPTSGRHFFTRFSAHRLFAKKVDLTGRLIYLSATSRFTLFEQVTGRLSNGNLAVPETFTAQGQAKRPSTVGDIGVTFLATSKLRISNTFRFDNFRINGSEPLLDVLRQSTVAGVPLATITTNSFFSRTTNYRRFMNTAEVDYQLSPRYAFHVGYRFTDRHIELFHLDVTTSTSTEADVFDNRTHSFIYGLKARPVKGWTIYFDGERGNADSVFTRLGNNDYTNFRVRNRITPNSKLALNVSLVTKDNTNPSDVIDDPAVVPPGTAPDALDVRIKIRNFSSSVDWTPTASVSVSGGYTHLRVTSIAGILLPISGQRRVGESQFFSRDNFFFFNVFARPLSRVTLYGGYRINKDPGQGDRISSSNVLLIDSYPMTFQSPEARVAVNLNRNVEWNFGYQYFNYRDRFFPIQNYRTHLPYMSLRFYFGQDRK